MFIQPDQFNKKYNRYLCTNAKGLDIPLTSNVLDRIDQAFQEFVKIPNFTYSLIEYRNGKGHFEASNLNIDQLYSVEKILNETRL